MPPIADYIQGRALYLAARNRALTENRRNAAHDLADAWQTFTAGQSTLTALVAVCRFA
jgi:hypothetical protein